MTIETTKIPRRQKCVDKNHPYIGGSVDIIDDSKNKTQEQINSETEEKVSTLEESVGTGGSVDQRIAEEGAKHYLKTETYNKTELNSMITTPNQGYVTVTATSQTTAATDVLPATGAADTVYRVGNWNGTQYSEVDYTEYAWNGSAYVKLSTKSQIGEVYDISANHANTKYADLSAALGTNGANIPQSLRKGGMSVKYVQTSDNKYVQNRYMSSSIAVADFTNVANWQGVDDEPTAGSDNLVKSGGIAAFNLKKQNIGIDYEVKASDFSQGKKVHTTYGFVQNNTSYRCTEQMIPIPDGAKYIVLNKPGSQYSPLNELFNSETHITSGLYSVDYCYYDANETFMPYDTNQARLLTNGGGHIPDGAKFLRINDSNDFTNGHLLTFYSSLPKFDVVKDNNIIHIDNTDWLVGYRVYNGISVNKTTGNTGIYKRLLNIDGVKQIESNLRQATVGSYYEHRVFYDVTGKMVLLTNNTIISELPDDAAMILCSDFNVSEERDVYVQLFIEEDNSSIKADIRRVTDAVTLPVSRYKDNGIASLFGGAYVSAVGVIPYEYLGNTIKYQEASSSFSGKTTGPIRVEIGDYFEYKGITWGGIRVVLLTLDENFTIIETIGITSNSVNVGTYTVTSPFVKYIIYNTVIKEQLAPSTSLYLKWYNRQVKYSIENSDGVMNGLVSQIEQLKAKLIAQDVNLNDIMPADYQISTEIAVANKNSKNLSSLISFAVFTDSHYKGGATGDTVNTYPRLCNVIKYLYDKGQIQFAMALGDNIDNLPESNYTDFKTLLNNTGCPYGLVIGNHDLLKPSVLRNGQYTIDGVVRGDSHNDTWYYFDIDDIRFIVLNGVDKKADDDADTQTRGLMYNGMSSYQIQWLISTLATNKKVVIMSHYSLAETYTEGGWSMTVPNDYDKALTIVEAFIGAESGSVTLDDESVISYDFSNQDNGVVLGVLCGHAHGDRLQFKNNKFHNIWLDNSLAYDNIFSSQWSQGDMTLGKYTEVAMDIVTIDKTTGNIYLSRIGRGSNREVINSEE